MNEPLDKAMSPLEVEILLHYWCSSAEYDPERINCPAQQSFLANFVSRGLLTEHEGETPRYRGVTEALRPYVEAVLAVPLPVQRWVIPEP